jgi:hypothetical protein
LYVFYVLSRTIGAVLKKTVVLCLGIIGINVQFGGWGLAPGQYNVPIKSNIVMDAQYPTIISMGA